MSISIIHFRLSGPKLVVMLRQTQSLSAGTQVVRCPKPWPIPNDVPSILGNMYLKWLNLQHIYIYVICILYIIYINYIIFLYQLFFFCVCVCGGNPCSEGLSSHVQFLWHVQFLVSVPNLQAGAHGILDPPCATKLRSWMGYQGWSPWRTCSWSRCSFIIQAFWWLSGYYFLSYAWIIREIGVRYAFFRIYPFLRLLSNVDKDGLPELSM